MKLIDEIKKAEEKAEKKRKDAEIQGQKLLEKEQENAAQDMAALNEHKEKLTQKKLAQAREQADKDIKDLDKKHQGEIENLRKKHKKIKNNAVKTIQELIIKWPSSR
jgi:vacuolar-type H+-ATPase subunit H